ncbi:MULTISPECIES: bifunctional cobalt-precorrin-7 (C(5))-methyltransferase/cobalt-precorrin-6B (C(15))-methyltransferase [unclassified Sulfitobacter]|uniref:bifunctional cobalt-precorrin-7 (C(5))-methyltransferase/cobalt-precorrin-6B (C(15))-methyltransferase n=1 Tax=Sulfitobacter TaxID=60136 RepID=UPI000066A695|nr:MULTISPECIES: bifunctional cobalt-precorrin-7 (C(5))-methyltransferase/cobalt-precorrin-6B (C(15))-methyltransferase [unclassified Sulfitobacter]AXI52116.1 bifunctional cobalt-precorrin-7 (C(5))-methyltransferase/cobalt-precorrin-6B (C(15))-methyltransferase [Sulfitobacter sp. SK025]EAP82128.1 Putative Precorrin-6y C5,15-methyltransferase [Sulfitobacter sp. NAS-14.1]
MADPVAAWVTLIGLGEDGLAGLTDASRKALAEAEVIFGGPRHLALCDAGARGREWPLPFSVEPVLEHRGRAVVVLASGDPFWHGVGGSLAQVLDPSEWRCFPAPSCMTLAAARLGWRLEEVTTLGLHAAPFEVLVPHLAAGARLICTLRDGAAPAALADYLTAQGFGASRLTVMEALGGPREIARAADAATFDLDGIAAPVVVAIAVSGGAGISHAPGRPEALFAHDSQITKSPMRALTLAALAPRAGELLWDVGGGSGSVSVEWCLAAPQAQSIAIEPRESRCDNIIENARRFGLAGRMRCVQGTAPEALADLPSPAAVFLGGGATEDVLQAIWHRITPGTRLVANAVALETQALLIRWHGMHGGQLLRIDLAQAAPLGTMQGWHPSRPQLQWSVTR